MTYACADRPAFLYVVTNRVNGKRYVGVTSQRPHARWGAHQSDARNGSPRPIAAAIRKYGVEALEFLPVAAFGTFVQALRAERAVIAEMRPEYNQTQGGDGMLGFKRSAESVAKTTAAMRGRRVSAETRAKLRAHNLGKKNPKSGETKRGQKLTALHREAISNSLLGRVVAPETRAKIAKSNRGKKHSAETCAKMRAAWVKRRARV